MLSANYGVNNSRIISYHRRRKLMVLCFIYFLYRAVKQSRRVHRSSWMRRRSGHWWNYIAKNTFNDLQWVEKFRVKKDTFKTLCTLVRPFIRGTDTKLRKCISVELRVAISLYVLGNPDEYRTIGYLFGVSRSSVCLIVQEFCKVVSRKLTKRFVYLPNDDELCNITLGFEQRWGFPNCGGAIDGCHIPIVRPVENRTDYYNGKGWYSILLQAVVDNNYLFRDTCIGWPGSVHDARVLANSKLYELGEDGNLFRNNKRNICGVSVPVVILGDPAYPLLKWLMKPFPDTTRITPEQKRFNDMLSSNRMVVENAFGRLKGRWRRLQKRVDCNIKDVPSLISTCCVLHNICETQGDEYLQQWDDQQDPLPVPTPLAQTIQDTEESEDETQSDEYLQQWDDQQDPLPVPTPLAQTTEDTEESEDDVTSAENIRNAFARFFMN